MRTLHRDILDRWNLWAVALMCGAALSCAAGARGAMEIEGLDNSTAPASNYDRFDNDPGWIGNPANWPGGAPAVNNAYPWQGVGRDSTLDRWGTLISPSFIISANHYPPVNGDTIQFNYNNDPNGPTETRTVIASESLQASVSGDQGDVWIGELNAPITDIASYPILTMPFYNDYSRLGISTFGISSTFPGTATTVRMGRNVIDSGSAHYYTGFDPSQTGGVSNAYAFQYTYNNTPSNRGVGNDEAQVMPGDSGAPTFFLYGGGTPALLGLHWLEGTDVNGNPLSLDTWVSPYVNDIQTGMNQLEALEAAVNSPAVGETVKTIKPLLGDFNFDGHVNAADISAMEAALANLNNFESSHGLSSAYVNYIGDLNGDGQVNNADLQVLINDLKTGHGSFSETPEPGSVVLLGLGGLALAGWKLRRRRR
jgi:hypothetical protein